MNYIVGLGNPEEKYFNTRHNIGRFIVEKFAKNFDFDEFVFDKKINALISEGKIGKEKAVFILPETYMNNSGLSLKKIIDNQKKAEKLIVVQDDLDMGIGTMKIVFNKSSAGHRGIDSIIKSIGHQKFVRIKIGISPTTSSGKVKKPKGEEKVIKHVLGKISPKEQEIYKKIIKKTLDALQTSIEKDYLTAMNKFN